jgi:hypothetical protein
LLRSSRSRHSRLTWLAWLAWRTLVEYGDEIPFVILLPIVVDLDRVLVGVGSNPDDAAAGNRLASRSTRGISKALLESPLRLRLLGTLRESTQTAGRRRYTTANPERPWLLRILLLRPKLVELCL